MDTEDDDVNQASMNMFECAHDKGCELLRRKAAISMTADAAVTAAAVTAYRSR